ncbi:ribosomal protection-like ABC-F family protein [Paenibacillus lautus]|uniref:ABC transporter ATP-binding protein n=1 Tax=Paenibacillus lautus TaxID=1401 RepID=A0A385TQ03_PAELA|nr:ABC-F family ATP-binding cassette domain-containing protein [Paenibacillus lautus]AYB45521.1 ABC transporter ATP-binding protein [Paenibacillus lautus]MBY0158227.1 ABC-F family ATP-binding cassette domain-containing protein [Cytobacillus firmus]
MNMINVQKLTQYHGAQLVLDGISFEIQEGEKVALIGRNGSGKSTLMRLLAGLDQPNEGQLAIKKDTLIGYVEQIPSHMDSWTVLDVLSHGLIHLKEYRAEMTELEKKMSDPGIAGNAEQLDRVLRRYSALQERFETEGGYELEASIDKIATGLQIPKSEYGLAFGSLSGGEKTRVVLASQLIVQPDLLLLDEPTNHLDLARTEWLEEFLREYPGTCIIISHDRYFLDRVVTKTIELEDGEAFSYQGGYTAFMKDKEERLLQQFADYQEQQKVIKKMKESIKQLEEFGRIGGNEKFFKRAASMRRALERMEKVKRPVLERRQADFELHPQDRSGRRVAYFEQVEVRYGNQAVLEGASGLIEFGEKIALMGPNGSGKTTLFKVLVGELMPDSGSLEWGARVDVGYLAQQEEPENPKETVLQYFRENAGVEEGEARGILARYLFYGAAVFRSVGQLSGGEWTRLRLALLIHQKPNLLLLDEPTNHLDIASREALEDALQGYQGTVLAISHDRYFVNQVSGKVWDLNQGTLTVYHGNYDDFRAKKDQLEAALQARELAAGANAVSLQKGTPPSKAKEGPGQKFESNQSDRSAAERSKWLEEEIARLETRIRQLDGWLETEGSICGNSDMSQLEERWNERESLAASRDELLAEWLELS